MLAVQAVGVGVVEGEVVGQKEHLEQIVFFLMAVQVVEEARVLELQFFVSLKVVEVAAEAVVGFVYLHLVFSSLSLSGAPSPLCASLCEPLISALKIHLLRA